jgi:hypothetical protein
MPCLFHVYGYRPFAVHGTRGAILQAPRVQKLSPEINVELGVSQEVFEHHADRIVSQRQGGGPCTVTTRAVDHSARTMGAWAVAQPGEASEGARRARSLPHEPSGPRACEACHTAVDRKRGGDHTEQRKQREGDATCIHYPFSRPRGTIAGEHGDVLPLGTVAHTRCIPHTPRGAEDAAHCYPGMPLAALSALRTSLGHENPPATSTEPWTGREGAGGAWWVLSPGDRWGYSEQSASAHTAVGTEQSPTARQEMLAHGGCQGIMGHVCRHRWF